MPIRLLAHVLVATALLGASPIALAQPAKQPKVKAIAGPQPLLRANFVAQMDAQFAKVDADKNGQLSRGEIEQFEQQKALADALAANEAWFEKLDTNKNGQLSATEFAKMVREPAAASAQPMLSREDGNRDGQISLVEHRVATLANFDRIDSDKDGVVTPAEMAAGGVVPR